MVITPYTPADARAVTDIYNHYVTATTATFETRPLTAGQMAARMAGIASEYPSLVAKLDDGTPAGYCYAHKWKSFAAYSRTLETTIYIREGLTSRRLGRALMLRLIDECRARAIHSLIACITAENQGSIRFHESLGFRRVSYFKEAGYKFGRYLDVADLQLLL